jgi:hypothetical protein
MRYTYRKEQKPCNEARRDRQYTDDCLRRPAADGVRRRRRRSRRASTRRPSSGDSRLASPSTAPPARPARPCCSSIAFHCLLAVYQIDDLVVFVLNYSNIDLRDVSTNANAMLDKRRCRRSYARENTRGNRLWIRNVAKRLLSAQQLPQKHAKRKNIDARIVGFARQQFRRSPSRQWWRLYVGHSVQSIW